VSWSAQYLGTAVWHCRLAQIARFGFGTLRAVTAALYSRDTRGVFGPARSHRTVVWRYRRPTTTRLRFWDIANGECRAVLQGHTDTVATCGFSPDGRLVASSSADHTLRLWDVPSGQCLAVLGGHVGGIGDTAFSPDGRLLVSGSADCTLRLWDITSGSCRTVLEGHTGGVGTCSFSRDGRLLVSGSADHTLRLWDTSTGACRAVLEGHGSSVYACAQGADGRLALSGSHDHTLRLWDLETLTCRFVLEGHEDSVKRCLLSFDSSLAVSASADKTLRLWDVATGRCHTVLEGHDAPITSCALSSDGRFAVSGSEDTTLRVWEITSAAVPLWPSWLSNTRPFTPEAPTTVADPDPLLPRRTARGVLQALLATYTPGWRVDTPRAVALLARGAPIRAWPRHRDLSLARGVAMLIDTGPGLDPYRADVTALVRSLRTVLSKERLAIDVCPGWPPAIAAPGERGWAPLPTGTPVLVVSDFGLSSRRARPEVWANFAAQLRHVGCVPVGLTPFPPLRWPPLLMRAFHLTYWDRSTTARMARRTREARQTPQVVASARDDPADLDTLSRALAPAARIERSVLRAARRLALPNSSPALEARFWWSDRIGSRGELAITWTAAAAQQARALLRRDGLRADDPRLLSVQRLHRAGSPMLRLEEELIALDLLREPGWEMLLADRLRSLLRTLVEAPEPAAMDVARWSRRVLPEFDLPEPAQEPARELLFGTDIRLGREPESEGVLAVGRNLPAWLLRALRPATATTATNVRVAVSWKDPGLVLDPQPTAEAEHTIDIISGVLPLARVAWDSLGPARSPRRVFFVSYRRDAHASRVETILRALREAGHQIVQEREITPGSSTSQILDTMIGESDAALIVTESTSRESVWRGAEAIALFDHAEKVPGRFPILVVPLDTTAKPGRTEGPLLAALRSEQALVEWHLSADEFADEATFARAFSLWIEGELLPPLPTPPRWIPLRRSMTVPAPPDGDSAVLTAADGSSWRIEDVDRVDAGPPLRLFVAMQEQDRLQYDDMLDAGASWLRRECGLHDSVPVLLRMARDPPDQRAPPDRSLWRVMQQELARSASVYLVVVSKALAQPTWSWELLAAVDQRLLAGTLWTGSPDQIATAKRVVAFDPDKGAHDSSLRELASRFPWLDHATWVHSSARSIEWAQAIQSVWRRLPALAAPDQEAEFDPTDRATAVGFAQVLQALALTFHLQRFDPTAEPSDAAWVDRQFWGLDMLPQARQAPEVERSRTIDLAERDFTHVRQQAQFIYTVAIGYLNGDADPFLPPADEARYRELIVDSIRAAFYGSPPLTAEPIVNAIRAITRFARPSVTRDFMSRFGSPETLSLWLQHDRDNKPTQEQIERLCNDAGAIADALRPFATEFNGWRLRGIGSLDSSRSLPEYIEGFNGLLIHYLRTGAHRAPETIVGPTDDVVLDSLDLVSRSFASCFVSTEAVPTDLASPTALRFRLPVFADLFARLADRVVWSVRAEAARRFFSVPENAVDTRGLGKQPPILDAKAIADRSDVAGNKDRMRPRRQGRNAATGITTVYFATNRVVTDASNAATGYQAALVPPSVSTEITYGTAFVDGMNIMADRQGSITSIQDTNKGAFAANVAGDLSNAGRNLLVFIHGFGNTFEDGVTRAAFCREFLAASGMPGTDTSVLAFSWPSLGKIVIPVLDADYRHDQKMATLSGVHLMSFFAQIEPLLRMAQANGCRTYFLAHGMGNLTLESAVENWFLHGNGSAELFNLGILAASDCGFDAFAQPNLTGLDGLSLLASRVSIYYSGEDQVLNLSRVINGRQRLGQDGPIDRTDQTKFPAATYRMVDAAGINDYDLNFLTSHQYYCLSPAVRAAIAVDMAPAPKV
jgi:esterase/lipase superfamily enzyme